MNRAALSSALMVLMLMFAGAAVAMSGREIYGPTWQSYALAACSLVFALMAAYLRGLEGRVSRVEQRLDDTRTSLLGDYHDKTEIEHAVHGALDPMRVELTHIAKNLEAVHRRLDHASFSRVSGQHPTTNFGDRG